jgi:CMP-N,N'-diacetyllegionaminic acid synthase
MHILAVIPARGGSKGVPGKNIKHLAGKPLIAWTLEAAKHSKLLTRTIVSTDDENIASVAREYGGEVPFLRPKELAQDLSTDVEFLEHALQTLRSQEGYEADIVVRLPPTSPLRTAEDIDRGIQTLLDDTEADASRPIIEAPKHPYKMWKVGDKYLEPFLTKDVTGFDEPYNLPRQLFPKVYIHTGAMDVMRRATIEVQNSTSGKKLAYFRMDPEHSINIDYPIDFEIADYLMQKRLRA